MRLLGLLTSEMAIRKSRQRWQRAKRVIITLMIIKGVTMLKANRTSSMMNIAPLFYKQKSNVKEAQGCVTETGNKAIKMFPLSVETLFF